MCLIWVPRGPEKVRFYNSARSPSHVDHQSDGQLRTYELRRIEWPPMG